jgi:ubiquinone/menaquinone biosynthesis C-methylase UbiE
MRSASGPGVARAYDRWAASYDTVENATRDLDARVLRRTPLNLAGRDVLELGCGTGKNTAWLGRRARTVVALDFSAGMLAKARQWVRAAHVRFVQHDVRRRWPAPDSSVDLVVGNLVLEHVRDLGPIYREMTRVLRPGGRILLCELHPERQRRGGQARFTDPATGRTVRVKAYLHTVGEYVNGGIAAGLSLRHLGEWLEIGAPSDAPPRLLSVLFEKARA